MAQLNFKGFGMSDDLELQLSKTQANFTIPMCGHFVIKDTSEARRMIKALKIWADWKDLEESNEH